MRHNRIRNVRTLIVVGLLSGAAAPAARAAVLTTISVGQPLARLALLKPGVHRYLRYNVRGAVRDAIDVWSRQISFEAKDGKTLMHIVQRWDEAGKAVSLEQESWFERATFRPLTHVRRVSRDGKVEVGGYQFLPNKIVGLRDLAANARKDFSQASSEPAYNFEYDMEFLQSLPLADGYQASVPFYDPGLDPPARYIFKVSGSAQITGPDGRLLDCWVVTADYNTGKVVSRFWFDKRTQVLIREEQAHDDGTILVKTLLPPEAADA